MLCARVAQLSGVTVDASCSPWSAILNRAFSCRRSSGGDAAFESFKKEKTIL